MQEDPYQLYISQSINVKNVCMNVTKKSKHQENKQPSLKPHIKLNREFSRDETEMAEKQSGVGTGEGELSNPSLLLAGVSSPVHTVEISEVLRAPPKAENRSTSRSSCSTLSISPRTLHLTTMKLAHAQSLCSMQSSQEFKIAYFPSAD